MDKITISHPIEINGIECDTLSLRLPKVSDRLVVERLNKSDAEKEIIMIANLAEVAPEVIEELELADYVKLQDKLQDFLAVAQESQGKWYLH